jgi:hypothetical protein
MQVKKIRKCRDFIPVFDPVKFIDDIDEHSSYILGLLWADGHITNDKNISVSIGMLKDDIDQIIEIFKKTGKWNRYENKIRNNWKPISTVRITSRKMFEFLHNNDYKDKSYKSADKILMVIPETLHKYFFRGLIDGDGCFYLNEKNYCYQFQITSTIEQDWSYFENFLSTNNINYRIERTSRINKKGITNQFSTLRITNKYEIAKLFNVIYDTYEDDRIGLYRKYEKGLEIKNKSKIKKSDIITKRTKPLSIDGCFYRSLNFAATQVGISKHAISRRIKSEDEEWKNWVFVKK